MAVRKLVVSLPQDCRIICKKSVCEVLTKQDGQDVETYCKVTKRGFSDKFAVRARLSCAIGQHRLDKYLEGSIFLK